MRSICAVEGVSAAGIKEGKYGLALIRASGTAAGVFTRNLVRAAPVELMMERMAEGRLDGIIVNSGSANAYTGKRGYDDAVTMAEIGAEALDTDPMRVGVASTGVIGRHLDLARIRDQARRIAPLIARNVDAENQAAHAIMTTDLVPKHALVERKGFKVAGIAKGSGMIAPDMATMLAFLYTDAEIPAQKLKMALAWAAERSFNRVVVDGDMSTNDACFLTATGAGERPDAEEFASALLSCCTSLAVQIAADGEGATTLIEVRVGGAASEEDAAKVARTIVGSPLVKTAVYGKDPNWGRVVAAAGRAGVAFDPDAISLAVWNGSDRLFLVRNGEIVSTPALAKEALSGDTVVFELDLAEGSFSAIAWGCDLTEKYVEINGKYTT
jgi:glutamate N-acetyltransferase/amino-acid N-acetyltransferase